MVEIHETAVLWRVRVPFGGAVREVRCSIDHLGEGFFELQLRFEHKLLLNEPFQETETLLRRAGELRIKTKARGA